MRYQKIEVKIWNDEKFVTLTEDAKLLFLYLLTCPHSNALGVYVLKLGYIGEDLNWERGRGFEALSKLLQEGLIAYDKACSLVFVRNYLNYNKVSNENQFKNVREIFSSLPKSELLQEVSTILQALAERLDQTFEAPPKQHRSPSEAASKPEAVAVTEAVTDLTNPSFQETKLPSEKEEGMTKLSSLQEENGVSKDSILYSEPHFKSYEKKIKQVMKYYNNLGLRAQQEFYSGAKRMTELNSPIPEMGSMDMNLLLIKWYDRTVENISPQI